MRGCETQTPEMPRAYKPEYERWCSEFERHLITKNTILVGHSCGGGFLVRWLSETSRSVARAILVAPWMDPERNHCVPGFFDFEINPKLAQMSDLHLIYSDNDSAEVNAPVEKIIKSIPGIHLHLMSGMGHFCSGDMGGNQFVALRDMLFDNPADC